MSVRNSSRVEIHRRSHRRRTGSPGVDHQAAIGPERDQIGEHHSSRSPRGGHCRLQLDRRRAATVDARYPAHRRPPTRDPQPQRDCVTRQLDSEGNQGRAPIRRPHLPIQGHTCCTGVAPREQRSALMTCPTGDGGSRCVRRRGSGGRPTSRPDFSCNPGARQVRSARTELQQAVGTLPRGTARGGTVMRVKRWLSTVIAVGAATLGFAALAAPSAQAQALVAHSNERVEVTTFPSIRASA